jgi:hypothetical protein
MGRIQYENRARRTWWSVHIEALRKSDLSRRSYCHQHCLGQGTFARWLNALVDVEAIRVQDELKREERLLRWPLKPSSDIRSRAVQAFWAMHVEAITWSRTSVRAYEGPMERWRDLIETNEVQIDWRAQLHPSARANRPSSLLKNLKMESFLILAGRCWGGAVELDVF